ncbi:hypothetical protein [Streptomyces massasporeus]|uniref:hypothetical protein n=1 Tax=Streptomyces massasporeus TaxID=67324 RepID=UPI00382D808D
MTADQLPAEVREFVAYLDGLLARLDPSGGWCAVFWRRDPEGMRACLDGRDLPPWDVVEALLQDLAGQYGPGGAGPETERARALHAAALAAYDTRLGGRDALVAHLDDMLREQKYAAERQAALARHLTSATTPEQADALRLDLAWARDDHERAGARCAELRARMTHVDRQAQGARPAEWDERVPPAVRGEGDGPRGAEAAWQTRQHPASRPGLGETVGGAVSDAFPAPAGADPARHAPQHPANRPGPGEVTAQEAFPAPGGGEAGWRDPERPVSRTVPGGVGADGAGDGVGAPAPEPPARKARKRRRGGARFAGVGDEEAVPVVVPPAVVPDLPAPAPVATGRTPRGARFAGAAEEAVEEPSPREGGAVGAVDLAEVGRTVDTLARLRSEGRSGEAHALLAEVTSWEPGRFPLFAERLHRAGLDADWQTLLWEAASLPAERLVAAADALVEAGRAGDGQQMLRQGVARPPDEIGRAVLGLAAERRHREVRVLLDAYVRARTPEEAARSAEPDPRRLVPLLLEAAQGVSDERRWDLVHALRVAGFAA